MEPQVFTPALYSRRPQDLMPPDAADDDPQDYAWQEYCRVAASVSREDILACTLSDLDADDSPLYPFIDEALSEPHEPGRARDSVVRLAALGQAVLDLIAQNVDNLIILKMLAED